VLSIKFGSGLSPHYTLILTEIVSGKGQIGLKRMSPTAKLNKLECPEATTDIWALSDENIYSSNLFE